MTIETVAGFPTAIRHWNRGGDRTVLALHCSLAHAGAWSGLVERLAGVDVTAPDLPGHGNSGDWTGDGEGDGEGGPDLHALATRIAIQLAERAGRPVDLFGHSFGGTVALRVAVERPDLVRSLMLVEPVLFAAARGAPEWPAFRDGQDPIDRAFAAGDRAQAAALFHTMWGTGGTLDRLPARQRDYIVARMGLISALDAVLMQDAAGLLAPGRLEALTVPVLLAEGGESPAIIGAIQRELARRLPQVRRITVPGAGHMLPLTHAALLAPEVQAHLGATV